MKDLRHRAIRGGSAKVLAQAANFTLRIGSLMILARLLDPKDFGLVGMVTAITGVLSLFRDFGLSSATVQRVEVTDQQVSTLFWINVAVGTGLCLLLAAASPMVAWFYREPRLVWVTVALSSGFFFNALGIQHSAMLQREMRFTALSTIDVVSLAVSVATAVGMAVAGFRYWALVAMTVVPPFITTICLWFATRWVPGPPRKKSGIRSMVHFGGLVTLNGLIYYVAYNLDKVLLGRYWGAEAIGIYGRAYQLVNIPTDNLNSAVGEVAFSALSRVQNDAARLRSYFLKGYSMVLALTVPVTIAGALCANDLISVVLGPKWTATAPIFRLLAPTILIYAIINPLAWLLYSTGMVARSIKLIAIIAPLTITAYILGLPHGPKGVAMAYSTVMTIWVIPHILLCVRGTSVSFRDVMVTIRRPVVSGVVAGALAAAIQFFIGSSLIPLARVAIEGSVLLAVYLVILLYIMGQKSFYLEVFRSLRRAPVPEKVLVSA
ncbi:MAG TPA: lipopolysaccharide biosynthesis protein [Candidatus Aquilonibacter sp.]|nr:lipopolysaccharide biosynthesis protein [Candidatus Aquilonibacter sp.]